MPANGRSCETCRDWDPPPPGKGPLGLCVSGLPDKWTKTAVDDWCGSYIKDTIYPPKGKKES